MNALKVLNFQSQEQFLLPEMGVENRTFWLAEQGYRPCDCVAMGEADLELYVADDLGLYALYHPPFQGLAIECLYVAIPAEKDARELMALAQQMLGVIAQLMSTQGGPRW